MRRLALATLLGAALAARAEETRAVCGRVLGKDGTLLGVHVRVLVDGREVAASRTDINGRYRVEVPAGDFELEAKPESWTKLKPVRRRMTVAAGAEALEDFVLGGSAGASGSVKGASGDRKLTLLAIRAEDCPEGASVEELRDVRKIAAEARGTFTFSGLDPDATYRVTVDSDEWGLERPVLLRAGDTGVTVPIERLLRFGVEAYDVGARAPLARFQVKVVGGDGRIHETIEVRDGRLRYRARHPVQVPPEPPPLDGGARLMALRAALEAGVPPDEMPPLLGAPLSSWKIVVEAEGYFAVTGSTLGTQLFLVQRVRDPNVLLSVTGADGRPMKGELEGTFDAAVQPLGPADARVRSDGPGRYRATLPPGLWRLTLARGQASVRVLVYVPQSGTATVEPLQLVRGRR
jgi:hypothetical protein